MTKTTTIVGALTGLLFGFATHAGAQTAPAPLMQGWVNVNGGAQPATRTFSTAGTIPIYGEQATFTADHHVGNGPIFDVNGGYRIRPNIGAGAGWVTMRLARRVGPNGVVYSTDVQREMLDVIRRRVAREGLQNVRLLQGGDSSLGLPSAGELDAVLAVDVYPEVKDRVTFLRNLAAALKADGRIGIVNYKLGGGGPGPAPSEGVRVAQATVEADARAAGLRIRGSENLPYQYLLVLGKPEPPATR